MKVDKEKLNDVLRRLNENPVQRVCPICGGIKFSVSNTIFEMREFNNGNMVIGGNQSLYPVLPVSCDKCGNTFFLNALTLGLINQNKNEEEKK